MKFREKFARKHPFLDIYLKIFILAIIALPLRAKVATAEEFANIKLNGWVKDQINILSPETESRLNRSINILQQKNGTEIIIFTVPETTGYPNTKDFAARLLAYGSFNQEHLKDAVLLIFSRGDDRIDQKLPPSIEFSVGPKIAEAFPEEIVSSFMQKQIYPLVEQGKYEEAILQTNQGIINFLGKDRLETKVKSGFIRIIYNYYYFFITILVLSLIFVVVIALRNFSFSNQNRRDYVIINSGLNDNSNQNFVTVDVDNNHSDQSAVVFEDINIKTDVEQDLQVYNLEKPAIDIKSKIAHHQVKNGDRLGNIEFISDNKESENKEFIDNNIEHKIDFNTLEFIPLDDLENIVNEFQNLTFKLFEFVKNQEEELKIKGDLVKELKEKLVKCSPIEKLILESKLQELEESTSLLEETLVGQRTNLKKQQILLSQHLIIFDRRKNSIKDTEHIDYPKLENMPLNRLDNLVNNLENKYLKLVDFVNAQEEELNVQHNFLKQLEQKLSQSNLIKKSVLELEIKETKEVIELLSTTLSGQRHNLKIKQAILDQYLSIFNQRKIKLNGKKDDQTAFNLNINQVENKNNKILEKKEKSKEYSFQITYLPQTR